MLTRFNVERDFFAALDPSERDLLEYFGGGREVRAHRRRPPLSTEKVLLITLTLLTLISTVVGDVRRLQVSRAAVAAAPTTIPPLATEPSQVVVPERPAIVEPRGGDRASRSRHRVERRAGVRGSVRDVARRAPAKSTPWVTPLRTTRVTSCYGPRWGRAHEGIDFDGETGDVIRSVGPGVVVQAGWRYSGIGNSVIVDHGQYLTVYAHASRVTARVGQRINGGTVIAYVGTTGNVTGSHLHLAVANGGTLARTWNTLINPAPWLRAKGISVGRCG